MGQALYRKYRSRGLVEIVGQEHITQALASAVKNGRTSHAYLFTGPRGVGKTSIARILAHEINGLPYSDTSNLDIIEIDAASNRRIDDIRDLREKVHIAPTKAPYKVYIIDEVHMLTGESFNALLKTLEEPPAHVVFILATTESHKLPATIVSRTQRYSFRPIPADQVVKHLAHIAEQEKIAIDEPALQLIAEHGEGSFRDSISLLDQLANISQKKITADLIEQTLGLAPRDTLAKMVESIRTKDQPTLLAQLGQLAKMGIGTSGLLGQLLRELQLVASQEPSLYLLIDSLLDVPRAYDPWLKLITVLANYTQTEFTAAPKAKPSTESPVVPVPPPKKTVATVVAAPPKPIVELAPKPEPKPTPEPIKPAEASPPPVVQNSLKTFDLDQWSTVLAAIKKKSAPFYAVLRAAQPSFDPGSQTLTLSFRFQLHQKKLEDARSKTILAQTMVEVLGGVPIIKTALDKAATPPPVQAPKPTPEANSVMAMMGGGEVINSEAS